jgi:hypothetical protein
MEAEGEIVTLYMLVWRDYYKRARGPRPAPSASQLRRISGTADVGDDHRADRHAEAGGHGRCVELFSRDDPVADWNDHLQRTRFGPTR